MTETNQLYRIQLINVLHMNILHFNTNIVSISNNVSFSLHSKSISNFNFVISIELPDIWYYFYIQKDSRTKKLVQTNHYK